MDDSTFTEDYATSHTAFEVTLQNVTLAHVAGVFMDDFNGLIVDPSNMPAFEENDPADSEEWEEAAYRLWVSKNVTKPHPTQTYATRMYYELQGHWLETTELKQHAWHVYHFNLMGKTTSELAFSQMHTSTVQLFFNGLRTMAEIFAHWLHDHWQLEVTPLPQVEDTQILGDDLTSEPTTLQNVSQVVRLTGALEKVANLIAQGEGSSQIADALTKSRNTIRNQEKDIAALWGLETTAKKVMREEAIRRGYPMTRK